MKDLSTTPEIRDTMDRPIRDLRISVIDNCNLRFPYCMPNEKYGEQYEFMPEEALLTFEEITRLSRQFVRMGATKLRLTGGEPLLRKKLPELVSSLSSIDGVQEVALTTNGLLLKRHAADLRAAGLTRITVSLDSLDEAIAAKMNGRNVGPGVVLDGIEAAQAAGLEDIKINAVVQKGLNDHTVVDTVTEFRERGLIVRFIEYMDVGNRNGWLLDHVVPSHELIERIAEKFPLRPLDENYHGEVASRYAFEDGRGEVGFITAVTAPFCGSCTRARLSADGGVYTCLFATTGTDLRGPIRAGETDDELFERLVELWWVRSDRYSELRSSNTDYPDDRPKVEMFQIGG